MKYDVFISYSRKDFDEVSAVIETIRSALPDITCWFDITGIESGDEFEDKIISAIDNSSYVLFALSENSLQSQWTKDEVMYARNTDKKIIPVLLKGAKMKGWFLFKFGRVDCIDSTDALQIEKLVNNISSWTGKKRAGKNILEDPVQSEPLCPCGSGKFFKECHGKSVVSAERTWKVGDYYNLHGKEGVVFWVDESGSHGKIVSMDQANLQWYTNDEYLNRSSGIADALSDGMKNLQSIMKKTDWRERYPAFAWCADHGSGWYLPAVEELKELLLNDEIIDKVNKHFSGRNAMYSKGKAACYWSSTEEDSWRVLCVDVSGGYTYGNSGFTSYYVRAVSAF